MSRLCEGRVAIVTGAGRGLGREHALLLAKHGAKVVVNDIGANVDGSGRDASLAAEVVAEIKKAGGDAVTDGNDVSDWNGAKAMIDGAIKTYGRLDVLINNAGLGIGGAVADAETKKLDLQLNVNLRAVYLLAREAIPMLKEAGAEHGKALMVNTASYAGKHGQGWLAAYSATKFGVVGLSQALHKELAKDPAVLHRFKKEGQVAARFKHKNAIELYDFGQMEDGTYFMAMEFLSGKDLRDIIKKKGALELAETFDIMIQGLSALQAAR